MNLIIPSDSLGISPAWAPAFSPFGMPLTFLRTVRNLIQQNSDCNGEAGIRGSTNLTANTEFYTITDFSSFIQNTSSGK